MTIHPDSIRKLTDLWENCPVALQTSLIKKYLEQLNNGQARDWAEYLADEFCALQLIRLRELLQK